MSLSKYFSKKNTPKNGETEEVDLADIAWNPDEGMNHVREELESALNGDYEYSYDYWVHDINGSKALVCYLGREYFVVPFSVSGDEVTIADKDEWTPVEQAWIDSNTAYLAEESIVAEVFLSSDEEIEESDGLIWKTIAKEGTWKYSPGPNQRAVEKPLNFVRSGKSDKDTLTVSIEELKSNFESGAKQHVTVPVSHQDSVLENTGFIRKMKIEEDSEGKALLKAGIEFTEPDVKEKVIRKTIADISSGIEFNYIKKDSGNKYNAIVGHAALTNSPWLNGMPSFEVNTSENTEILAFSEEIKESKDLSEETPELPLGGEKVEVTDEKKDETTTVEKIVEVEVAPVFLSELGISEDEAKARLAEYASLKAEQKRSRIDEKCRKWQSEGVSPALVLAAKSILEADEGAVVLNLSEDGKQESLTAGDIVEKLITAAPHVNLTEDQITDEVVEGQAPSNDAEGENSLAKLGLAEKALAYQLMFEAAMSEEEAIIEAKRRLENEK